METTHPSSLCRTAVASLAANSSAFTLFAVILATFAGQLLLTGFSGSGDDRGSGRISLNDKATVFGPIAIRGSGRISPDPEDYNKSFFQQGKRLLAWRGSGRLDENPQIPASLGTLQS